MKKYSRSQLMAILLISILFIVVGIFGLVMSSFITTMVGFNLSALFLFFLGVFLRSEEENPDILTPPVLWFLRLLLIGLAIIQFVVFIPYWRDLPEYINKQYIVLEGYPTNIDFTPGGWSKYDEPALYVTVDGKELFVELYPEVENPEELYDKYFIIEYLPETEWIINLEMNERK